MSFNRARIVAILLLALAWGLGALRVGPLRQGSDDRVRQELSQVERRTLPTPSLTAEEERRRFLVVGGVGFLLLVILLGTARPAR